MSTAQRPESTAVARTGKRDTLELMEAARDRIEAFLPDGVKVERVFATVALALNDPERGDALRRCTPDSVVRAAIRIAQWGLEVGTTAHLVPFGATCTPVADYKGLAELMVASGAVRDVEPRAVYAGEPFVMRQGLNPVLEHEPLLSAKERGVIVGAYCILHLPFGRKRFDYMAAEDIDAIRKQYSKQWKNGPLTDWYAMKTIVRRSAKLVPKNPRLASVLARIDAAEAGADVDLPTLLPSPPQRPALYAGATDVDMKGLRYDTCTPVDPNPLGVPDGERYTPEQIAGIAAQPSPYGEPELPLGDERAVHRVRDES